MKHIHTALLAVLLLAIFAKPVKVSAAVRDNKASDSITVYVFLSETCPICQTLTLELKRVYETYHSKGVAFIGLFPNSKWSSESTVKKFSRKYDIPFDLMLDDKHQYVNRFAATTTPQIFVVRNADSKVFYKGKADNHFEALGKRREVTTEHYLESALENILKNQPVNPTETTSVGCSITP